MQMIGLGFFLLVINFIFSNFTLSQERTRFKDIDNQYESYSVLCNVAIKRAVEIIEKKSDLICISSGGSMPYDLQSISLDFMSSALMTMDEARKLHVLITEEIVAAINADENVRPYLRVYPFTPIRCEISLSFEKPADFNPKCVTFISMGKGSLHFYIADPMGRLGEKKIHQEPYEEARKIVYGSEKSTLAQ